MRHPDAALQDFLNVIRDEAAINPAFRNRLLEATQTPMVVAGAEDLMTFDPVEMLVRFDDETFARIYRSLTAAQLKSLLKAPPLPLATSSDLTGKTKPALEAMLLERVRSRAEETGRI
jgi:hypothetical protein